MSASLAFQTETTQRRGAQVGATRKAERPDELAALDRIGTVVGLRREESLFYEGDPADYYFKVVSGAVRSCKLLADGRRHIGDFFLPGDFIGLDAETDYIFSAEAVTETTVVRYSRRSVEALAWQEPKIGRRLLSIVCHELSAAQERMLLLSRKSADERIASFLLGLAGRSGGVDRIALPMTRTDIGDHLGLTMETVSRSLSQLKHDGVIALVNSHEVVIRDRDALEDKAEAGMTV
jgi:CRP-like cAMP-binding protein